MVKLQDKAEVWNEMKAKLADRLHAVVSFTANHNTMLTRQQSYGIGRHSNVESISYHSSARKAREAAIAKAKQIVASGDQGTLNIYKPNGACDTFCAELLK